MKTGEKPRPFTKDEYDRMSARANILGLSIEPFRKNKRWYGVKVVVREVVKEEK